MDAPVRDRDAMAASAPATAETAVIMVVRDREDLTLRALLSLAGADRDAVTFETVVVDDASTDGTADLLGRVEGTFSTWRNERPEGVTAGWDRAAASSRAATLVFMHNDLVATDGWLEALSAAFAADVGAVLPRVITAAGRDLGGDAPPCLAVRREVFAELGGFLGAAQPGRCVKASLLEAVEALGRRVVRAPGAVLLAP
jgi:glycosyltransferase involved in cell wall biosynthesis